MDKPAAAAASRWRRRKEARPGEIVAAALACFAERGFAATRLDDVARRAGVTKGTLYLYFPNKAELFKAVVRQSIIANIARGEALVDDTAAADATAAGKAEGAPGTLARLIAGWAGIMATPASAIPKIVIAEAGNFPDIARFYLEEVIHRGLGLYKRLLTVGIERGEFYPVDVEHAAYCLVAPLIFGMLWRHSFDRHERRPLDLQALAETHAGLLLRGLAPADPGTTAPAPQANGT